MGSVRYEIRSIADDRHAPAAGVVAGELAERALDLAGAALDDALDHHFGSPRHVETRQRSGGDRRRGVAQGAGHLVLGLVVRHRHARHDGDHRIIAECDGDREVLAA